MIKAGLPGTRIRPTPVPDISETIALGAGALGDGKELVSVSDGKFIMPRYMVALPIVFAH